MQIRRTRPEDHEQFLGVVARSGLKTSAPALRFYLEHPEIITYVAEIDGVIVGTGVATPFGRTGWIGALTVEPALQGRGIGARLLEWGEETLLSRGVRSLILTASVAGRPLYERRGYVAGLEYSAWQGPGLEQVPPDPGLRPMTSADWPAVLELDRQATGEERGALLRTLSGGWVVTDPNGEIAGYHLPAPFGGGAGIATNADAGLRLLRLIRGLAGANPAVIRLTAANAEGLNYVKEQGFAPFSRPIYMVKGPWPEPYHPERIWSMISFGVG